MNSSWPSSRALPAPVASPPVARTPPLPVEASPARPRLVRLVGQALRRYGLWILVLWGLGSAGLIVLVQARVRPVYEAQAWLRVEPVAGRLRPPTGADADGDLALFLRTQVQLLTSPAVLGQALRDPALREAPWVRRAADPQAQLRAHLQISTQGSLILVGRTSTDRYEAARTVNAVVRAYLETAASWSDQETRRRIEQLEALRKQYRGQIEQYRQELQQLVTTTGAEPGGAARVETERYRQYRARLGEIELNRLEAQATLEALRDAQRRGSPAGASGRALSGPELDQRVEQAFRDDPQVAALHAEIRRAQADLREAERLPPETGTAEVQRLQRRIGALRGDNEALWDAKQPQLRARLAESETPPAAGPAAADLRAAELRLAQLQAEEEKVRAEVETIRDRSRAEGNEVLRAQFLTSALNSTSELDQRVALMLDQLRAEAQGPARIALLSAAQPPGQPTGDPRPVLMAVMPSGLLLALVVLATLVEARAARVADPDELAARLGLGVLGIVPPLPASQTGPGMRALRDRRQVEELIQSLDHLRVALWTPAPPSGRRCVMLTSAMPGEGKTTLAAQLAGRCANAGLTTLLIDADLRRPALGRLLELPEGPGLADVLRGEAAPEEAMLVVGNAGGFHLLPAGGGQADPSRLLQGERLGALLARARATFQVVLIDVPPILPVPDALLIGHWTDGAVMAVRYDASRFPLVERARRRLAAAGIPVLGAVLNGGRPEAARYGAYGYYGARDETGSEPETETV